MKRFSQVLVVGGLVAVLTVGCNKSEEKAANEAPVKEQSQSKKALDWESGEPKPAGKSAKAVDDTLEWPMPGLAKSVEMTTDFGKQSKGKIPALWTAMKPYKASFLKNYKDLLNLLLHLNYL